jgi:hypothetical protein
MVFYHDKTLDVIYRDTSQMRVLNLAEAGLPEVPVIAAPVSITMSCRTPCTGTPTASRSASACAVR